MGMFDGRVALVTGAARGQGRSHAVRLAEEGADVVLVDICAQIASVPYPMASTADLDETVALVEATGRHALARVADVRDEDALAAAVRDGVDRFGRLDLVAANAGIHSGGVPTWEISEQAWTDLLDVNLTGVWLTCRTAAPHLIAGGRGGSIVITSSTAGLRAYPTIGHYVAAKHALVGLTKALAQELAPHGIRVNCVNPTQVDTPMIQNPLIYRLFVPDAEEPDRDAFAAASQAGMLLSTPWLDCSDVSDAVLHLFSERARFVTGTALPVDAGVLTA